MGKKTSVEVFGIKFDRTRTLLEILGHKSKTSINRIVERHGSLENFVKFRLKVNTDDEAKALLMSKLNEGAFAKTAEGAEMEEGAAQTHDMHALGSDAVLRELIGLAISDFVFGKNDDRIAQCLAKNEDSRDINSIKKALILETSHHG